jgi:Ca-activated chloride channel family protein
MSFLEPMRLWLVLAVVALVAGYVAMQVRRRSYAVRFTNLELLGTVAPKRPGWRRHVPAGLFVVALLLLTVGFARPTRPELVPVERATIMMAIDTSLSMQATDVEPSRLEAAQLAATDFVDLLPEGLNVGLVTFNGAAVVRVAPTTDREQVKRAIGDLELGERTAIGEAIFASLDAIDSVPPDEEGTDPPARIVLMSDGTTTDGRSNEAGVAAAVEQGVPVSTIAFGTPSGTITIPEEPFPIPVPVDSPALAAIAEQTEGSFYEAVSAQELEDVYADIGSSIGFTEEEVEFSTVFVGAALAALFATAALSLAWFSRIP